jgi:hypothetical protein
MDFLGINARWYLIFGMHFSERIIFKIKEEDFLEDLTKKKRRA